MSQWGVAWSRFSKLLEPFRLLQLLLELLLAPGGKPFVPWSQISDTSLNRTGRGSTHFSRVAALGAFVYLPFKSKPSSFVVL